MNKDRMRGKWKQLVGRIKGNFGKATGDRSAQVKGTMEEGMGTFQHGVGRAIDELRDSGRNPRTV